ncbi:MAG: hypothetical protein H7Z17_07965 [Fuerstia sp.]|nr:hypothetical protein [Fuerstiella sp.]
MHGFHAHDPFRQDRFTGKQSTAVSLTCMTVCFSLCLTSGCALTRKAWSGVHDATCGEPASGCSCTCGECLADAHVVRDTGYHEMPPLSSRPASQPYAATPRPPEGSRPIEHEIRPQAITMNGMPGIWTPSPPPARSEFDDRSSAYANNSIAPWSETESVAASPKAMTYYPPEAQQSQSAAMQTQPMHTPDAAPQTDGLQEYRTQVQILSEQILQMKNAQESIRNSQDSMQQSHAREILELKLQQTTADRDRLQREHELEQQLEKQRQRELETIDSLSQIIDGVVPAPAVPNAAIAPVPKSPSQSRQVKSAPPQNLPTVDEGS